MNMYIFGDVFLRSYYSIYDFESMQVGLALHTSSIAQIEVDSRLWLYLLLIGSFIVIVAGIVVYFILQNKAKREEAARQEQEYQMVAAL